MRLIYRTDNRIKKPKPCTGRDTIIAIVTIAVSLALLALVAAAYIAIRPREYEMPPIEEEQWDWSTWAPEPEMQPLGARHTLTIADANARIDRHNADAVAALTGNDAPVAEENIACAGQEPKPIAPPEDEVLAVAKLLGNAAGYGECYEGQIEDKVKVVWTVLNRVESQSWADTVIGVITQPGQFYGYRANTEPSDESLRIAREVLTAWYNGDYATRYETCGDAVYLYFSGNGSRENIFRESYK